MKKGSSGNSLIEYTLPLVVLVIGAGLVAILTDVPGRMAQYMADTLNGEQAGVSIAVRPLGSDALAGMRNGGQADGPPGMVENTPFPRSSARTGPGYASTQRACFGSGLCLDIPEVSGSPLDTTGGLGDGLTHQLADVLDQMAEQMERDGADSGMIDLVSRLANQGHTMGDHEKAMSDLMHSCFGGGGLLCENNPDVYRRTANMEKELRDKDAVLLEIHRQLHDYLAVNPNALEAYPEARQIIDLETQLISQIANNLHGAISHRTQEEAGHTFAVNTDKLAEVTHQSADSICTQGGHGCIRGGH